MSIKHDLSPGYLISSAKDSCHYNKSDTPGLAKMTRPELLEHMENILMIDTSEEAFTWL